MLTRESWLADRVHDLTPWFASAGMVVPSDLRVSCGWPSRGALATRKRRIGECWPPETSGDQHSEVFISPVIDDARDVLTTLVHELVHACVGCKHGHKAPFSKAAKKVGLMRPWTSSTPSTELIGRLHDLIARVVPYPHASLTDTNNRKKQTTRMRKARCPACGYTVRIAQKWIDVGMPVCPCSVSMEVVRHGDVIDGEGE